MSVIVRLPGAWIQKVIGRSMDEWMIGPMSWRDVRVVVLAMMLLTACGGVGSESSPVTQASPTGLSVEGIYERVQRSLVQPGMIYRTVIQRDIPMPETTIWVDAELDVAREQIGSETEGTTTITTAGAAYVVTPYDPRTAIARTDPVACPGASVVVATLLRCPNGPFETYIVPDMHQATATPEVVVTPGDLGDRDVVLLIARREQQPWRSAPVAETRRLYLDTETYLPIEEEIEREINGETTVERLTFAYEFVARDTLPTDFFEPVALRALRPDPAHPLDNPPVDFDLFWLGTQPTRIDGVPEVELWAADRYDITAGPAQSDQVTLYYTRAADPFGTTWLFTLTEYSRDVWESLPAGTHDPSGPCWTHEELLLSDGLAGTATIFRGYSWPDNVPPAPEVGCPTDQPNDQFLAHAFLDDTVIVIAPWDWPEQTVAGIEAIIHALDPRE